MYQVERAHRRCAHRSCATSAMVAFVGHSIALSPSSAQPITAVAGHRVIPNADRRHRPGNDEKDAAQRSLNS